MKMPAFIILIILSLSVSHNTCYCMTADSCMKSNYPLPGTTTTLTKYLPDGSFWGYISGTNMSNDLVKANYFSFDSGYPYVSGAYFSFGAASSTHFPEITFCIWNSSDNKPGKLSGSTTLPMSAIINDVANNRDTYIKFDTTIEVTGAYFIGVILPYSKGDTLALKSNSDNDTYPGTAWEVWYDYNWHAYSENDCWHINIANAIFPEICDKYSVTSSMNFNNKTDEINIYPNPSIDKVNIDFGNALKNDVQIKIYNLFGNCLNTFSFNKASKSINLDLKDLKQGVYVLNINYNKQQFTRKLTVIR